MKIKKLKENFDPFAISDSSFDDDIIVKIIFKGRKDVPLKSIKNTDFYDEYYDGYENGEISLEDLIFYSIEEYIYENQIGGYSYELYDKNGNKIDINTYLAAKKYNL